MILNKLPEVICVFGTVSAGFAVLRHGLPQKTFYHAIRKKQILYSVLVSAAAGWLFCSISFIQNYKDRSYTLKYNYEEADKGLCPNGTWLNVSDAVGEEVLEKIQEKTGYSDISGYLELSSAVDNASLDSKHPKIATDYSISCTPKSYSVDTGKLIRAAGEAYQEYFMEHCAEQAIPLEINLDGIEELEYQEIVDRLQIEAEKLKSFLSGYRWDNQGYQTDTTFSSLVQKTDDFINVELEKYQSFITENGIAKDPSDFKKTAEYKNVLLQKDYDKLMASYQVNLEAIDLYNSNMVSVVLVPTQDANDNFYMSRTKIGVDYFATDASSYSEQAASIKQQIDENTYESIRVLTGIQGNRKKADEMLGTLEKELEALSDQAQDFFKKFLEDKRDGYIQIVYRSASVKQAADLKGNTVKAVLLGCCVLIVLSEQNTNRRKKGEQL